MVVLVVVGDPVGLAAVLVVYDGESGAAAGDGVGKSKNGDAEGENASGKKANGEKVEARKVPEEETVTEEEEEERRGWGAEDGGKEQLAVPGLKTPEEME